MQHQRSHPVVGLVMMTALVAACDDEITYEPDPVPLESLLSMSGPPRPLELVVEAPDQVAKGEAVPMKMALRNTGGAPVKVIVEREVLTDTMFVNTAVPIYNFYVVGPNEESVRLRRTGPIAGIGSGPQTLRPNETLEYEWTWDQRDQDGDPVGSGTYQVIGTLDVSVVGSPAGGAVRSEPARVTIR